MKIVDGIIVAFMHAYKDVCTIDKDRERFKLMIDKLRQAWHMVRGLLQTQSELKFTTLMLILCNRTFT